jgi:hypothetical protein
VSTIPRRVYLSATADYRAGNAHGRDSIRAERADSPREGARVMGTIAIIVLVIGALAIGAAAQSLGRARWSYEWTITALAAAIGGFVASEYIGAASAWGPQYDGLAVVPALIGAALAAAFAELAVHSTGQTAS